MTVEPMTDAELVGVELAIDPDALFQSTSVDASTVRRIIARLDAERSRADAAEAARDAALARAMPEWRYLATWDAVNAVEARHKDAPAPGLYVVWKPGWTYPSAAEVQFGVEATNAESPAPDDYLLGAWVVGPLSLPDLPIPPTED